MNRDQLIQLVLAEAHRYRGVTEHPRGSNRGVEVDYWIRECGLDPTQGLPWCAAFVGQVGRQALGAAWPCPRTASVVALTLWAQAQAGVWQPTPAVGDLFVLWEAGLSPARYGHTGFVTGLEGPHITTIEGNTNGGGGREGYGAFERTRTPGPSDRFIRWAAAVRA